MDTKAINTSIIESKGAKVGRLLVANANHNRQTPMLNKLLLEASLPSAGIYYILRYPSGWAVFGYRFDEFPECDHSELWEDYCAPILGNHWGKQLKISPSKVEGLLKLYPYAFPRGRVTLQGLKGNVFHGNDMTGAMSSKGVVERTFSVSGKAVWEFDSHEQCSTSDRDAVRRLLKLTETWKATTPTF